MFKTKNNGKRERGRERERMRESESRWKEVVRRSGLMAKLFYPRPIYCEVSKGQLLHTGLSVTNYIIYSRVSEKETQADMKGET